MQESINNSNINENPFIKVENPYEVYFKLLYEELYKQHADEMLELGRLCYQVFERTEDGKQLLKALIDKFIVGTEYNKNDPKLEQLSVYYKGFADCIRNLSIMARTHIQRLNHEHRQTEVK